MVVLGDEPSLRLCMMMVGRTVGQERGLRRLERGACILCQGALQLEMGLIMLLRVGGQE